MLSLVRHQKLAPHPSACDGCSGRMTGQSRSLERPRNDATCYCIIGYWDIEKINQCHETFGKKLADASTASEG